MTHQVYHCGDCLHPKGMSYILFSFIVAWPTFLIWRFILSIMTFSCGMNLHGKISTRFLPSRGILGAWENNFIWLRECEDIWTSWRLCVWSYLVHMWQANNFICYFSSNFQKTYLIGMRALHELTCFNYIKLSKTFAIFNTNRTTKYLLKLVAWYFPIFN